MGYCSWETKSIHKGPISTNTKTNKVTIRSDKTVRSRAVIEFKTGVQLTLEMGEHNESNPPTYSFLKASKVILRFLKYFVDIMRN